jgi:hypothetical protein
MEKKMLMLDTYELLTNMIFHISVKSSSGWIAVYRKKNNYKSYLSFFGKPEVNRYQDISVLNICDISVLEAHAC